MKHLITCCLGAALLLTAGCATTDSAFEQEYRPSRTGDLADGESSGNIEITLQSPQENTRRGIDLVLSMSIRNIGSQPVVFTQAPEARMTWIYPDGRRDNLLGTMSEASGLSGLKLEPGQEVVRHPVIKTARYNRPGITEFRASLSSTGDGQGWNGKAVSNGWGIQID